MNEGAIDEDAIDQLARDGLAVFFTGLIDGVRGLYPDGGTKGNAILVHSSLSAFGFVPGAERSVTEALVRSCERAGLTLVMPAHGGNNGTGKDCPAMGRIAEYFRKRRDTKRSAHPDLSFCARGPAARRILKKHRAREGVGIESPVGELYRMDAIVLMLGTGYDTCTVMHLAEYAEAERMRAESMVPDTVTCWSRGKSWEEPAFYPERFPAIGKAFEKENPDRVIIRPLPDAQTPYGQAGRELVRGGLTLEKEGLAQRRISPGERAHARAMRIRDLVDFSIDRYRYLR